MRALASFRPALGVVSWGAPYVNKIYEILHFQEASWTRLLRVDYSGVISEWKKGNQHFGENTGELTIGRRVKKHDYFQKKTNESSVLERR